MSTEISLPDGDEEVEVAALVASTTRRLLASVGMKLGQSAPERVPSSRDDDSDEKPSDGGTYDGG